jgi:hypothetical protein
LEKDINESSGLFSSIPQSPQISAIYDDIEELTELLAIYFEQGIEKGEYCLWLFPDEMSAEKAKSELIKSRIDLENYIASSQLEFQASEQLPTNINLLESSIKELAEKGSRKALSGGFAGFRTNFDLKNSGISLKPYLETCKKR